MAVKYTGTFDSFTGTTYTVTFDYADYSGSSTAITFAGDPVTIEYPDDSPDARIKGARCVLRFISDGIDISDFNSDNDITVTVTSGSGTWFKGIVSQDDTREELLDWAHIIEVTALDGLGLLKDITLDRAAQIRYTETTYNPTALGTGDTLVLGTTAIDVVPGNYIEIIGTPSSDGVYEVLGTDIVLGSLYLYLFGLPNFTSQTITLKVREAFEIEGQKLTLIELISLCLQPISTANIRMYGDLIPSGAGSAILFEEVLINANDFKDGDNWLTCYEILDRICDTFRLQLFQSSGVWYFVRWAEMRRASNVVRQTVWTYLGVQVSTNASSTYESIEPTTFLTGASYSFLRPLDLVQRDFDYQQPEDLLLNADMQDLGEIVNVFIDGSNTCREYTLLNWSDGVSGPYPSRLIRVCSDTTTGEEVERYMVLKGDTGDSARSAASSPIEVSEGDKMNLRFSFKTANSNPGAGNVNFGVRLYDGTNTYYLKNDGTWGGASDRFIYTFFAGSNLNEWQDVDMVSDSFPTDGQITVFMAQNDNAGSGDTRQTYYKDWDFELKYFVNGQGLVTGHQHTRRRSANLKVTDTGELNLDDCPKNNIKGCLYLDSISNLIQDRTNLWDYFLVGPTNLKRLWEHMTNEVIEWRGVYRRAVEISIIEFTTINQMPLVQLPFFTDKWFIFGRKVLKLKDNRIDCSLYELYDENDTAQANRYTFKYLTK